ncbi:type II toxin-antitoxin system RelE/ParE family toxin [Bremerella cremea]|uniref:Type II toxin-antitoxin system RelE/ParE family toxin n=1 Tax=Bremerella cremea TaxID=1031537 RepID=A0A368KJ72_9BACT|nr:type II toxin-antitoxin system RelE/ParE family toxin [Bremerella cremea]RCS40604.1 type II toxin-antitoxin system RelE/ParE family toxin [Bremerella cremea]
MTKPTLTYQAEEDLDQIVSYIARDKSDAALKWLNDICAKFYLLAQSPEIGDARSDLGHGIRCTFFKRYVIYFRKANNSVEILRVLTGDQDTQQLY